MSPSPKPLLPILLLLGALCGGVAGFRASASLPKAPGESDLHLYEKPDWAMTRDAQHPIDVSPAQWQPFLELLGDFDLQCDVELSADTDFDLILRRVEPRPVQGQRLPFHGRFVVLRLSSHADGPAFLTREQALFGPKGGARIEAGYPATVLVEARGRRLRAQIAGHPWTPWFEAADEHGSLAVAAHGGHALVHSLRFANLGPSGVLPMWPLGVAVGMLLAGLGFALGICRKVLAVSLLLWPLGTEVARRCALGDLLPLATPENATLLWLLAAGAPLTLALWADRGRWWLALPLALLAWFAAVVRTADLELPRRAHGVSPLIDVVFGADAADGLAEALAYRIRGPQALHALAASPRTVVMLLGGQLLYGAGTPVENLELQLLGDVRRARGKDTDVIALPTVDGWSLQQWLLFDTFYRDYHPRVLVFGVPADEAAMDTSDIDVAGVRRLLSEGPQRSLRDATVALPLLRPDGVSGLLGFYHQRWPITLREPRANPERLQHTLQAVQAYAAESGCKLLLLTGAGLPPELLEVVRAAAKTSNAPLLELSANDLPVDAAKKLSAAVLPLLP